MTEKQRAGHRARIQAALDSISPEEDAALTKAALDDPDTVLITELSRRKPGRPLADITKTPVSIRLSPDVVDYFRSSGPGWQSRIDDVLRKAAGLKKRA
ncbi:BrnA antitoxin family protein [Phyllobacterium meliloti]|uniref:BrnA antitoxin family protein n=1 Tax=Phyllobacterium meliloti TaxID=555317 RepID=UPI000DDE80D0|nr:BrnA antitoxin family protein [Phyllobacterium sp. T1293]UGX85917.1 BrnA antitoxin family protein [Phyllobacterium sp. T1293]